MNVLEKEIEDLICESLDKDPKILHKRGLDIHYNYIRQLNLGSYGIADIVSFCKNGRYIYIKIFELKKDIIDTSSLMQATRYAKGIDRILNEDFDLSNHYIEYSFALIGKQIQEKGDFVFLAEMLNIELYTYSISIDKGVVFKKHSGYFQHNEMRGAFTMQQKKYIKNRFRGYNLDIEYNLDTLPF